jgi:hypothetical protein
MGKSNRVVPEVDGEEDDDGGKSVQSLASGGSDNIVKQARERERSIGDMISSLKLELEVARSALRRAEGIQHLGTTGAVGGGVDTGGAAEMIMDARNKVSTLEAQLLELHHASKFNQEEMLFAEKEQKEAQRKREAEAREAEIKRKELEKKRETEELEKNRKHLLERFFSKNYLLFVYFN